MALIQSYSEEMALLRKGGAKKGASVLLLALALMPIYAPERLVFIATVIAIYSIGVQGQNLLIGYTGQISFGQSGFLAVGAYTLGHLATRGTPWPISLLCAGFVAGLFGLIVGFPSLRLRGPYLAIVTLGFGVAACQVFVNFEVLSGGRMGLTVPKLSPLLGMSKINSYYYCTVTLAILFTIASCKIVSSYLGRAFIAIRDNETAAEIIGVDLTHYKLLSFGISSFYTGVQGGLYALLMGYLEPSMFNIMETITFLVAIIVGGIASIEGSFMGAAFVILIPKFASAYQEMVPVIYGLAIMFVLIFEPKGLFGRWRRLELYFANWPFR
jgi:branched-chain amino acid transport system permease protein